MKLETVASLVSSIVFGVLVSLCYLVMMQFSLSGYLLFCVTGVIWLLCNSFCKGIEKGIIKVCK